jgi:DNA invertase Pin-like site-specific DNA recombinase
MPAMQQRTVSSESRSLSDNVRWTFFAILGVAAKLEHRRIVERTARGRADAKAKDVKYGRKPKLATHQQREAQSRLAAGETQRSVARSFHPLERCRLSTAHTQSGRFGME